MTTETATEPPKPSQTYEAGCHCGYIKFSVTLSPPLPEYKPLNCDCSACRRFGYLLVCMCTNPLVISYKGNPYQAGGEGGWRVRSIHIYVQIRNPDREKVQWHGDSEARVSRYRFNTKQKDQMFCSKCGASLGIDFRDFFKPKFDGFGISVRTFNGIDLDSLEYKKFNGSQKVEPAGDLSGMWHEEGAETVTKTT